MTFDDDNRPAFDLSAERGIDFARKEDRLRQFIRAKVAGGVISQEDCERIVQAVNVYYKRRGLLSSDTDHQGALFSTMQTKAMVAAQMRGFQLLKEMLLDFYPDLKSEVNHALGEKRTR